MATKKFPKTVYVKYEDPGTPEEFLDASADPSQLAEPGLTIRIGRYELAEVMSLRNATVLLNAGK